MGYIKLNRNLPHWQWYGDDNTLLVLVRLTLQAAWRDTQYQGVALKRGQVVTTQQEIMDQNHITKQQARTILDRLKSTGKITVERTSKFSIITLLDYDCFFENNTQNNIQITHEQHTEQQTDNTPTLLKEKEKKIKKERKEEGACAPAPSPTREQLVRKYGERAVSQYEQKYQSWQQRKGISGGISYARIAEWLIADGVPEQNSSIDQEDILRELQEQYSEEG